MNLPPSRILLETDAPVLNIPQRALRGCEGTVEQAKRKNKVFDQAKKQNKNLRDIGPLVVSTPESIFIPAKYLAALKNIPFGQVLEDNEQASCNFFAVAPFKRH